MINTRIEGEKLKRVFRVEIDSPAVTENYVRGILTMWIGIDGVMVEETTDTSVEDLVVKIHVDTTDVERAIKLVEKFVVLDKEIESLGWLGPGYS